MSVARFAKSLIVGILICASIRAQTPVVVYESSTNYSGKFNQSTNEYGDEIILMGNKRVITQMQFEYYGNFVPTGDEIARIRFYPNTGPVWMNNNDYHMPASPPLWETTIPVGLGFNTATIAVPNITVPLRFTWTVQFFGIPMTATENAGLLMYGDPIVGSSFNDFWELRPSGWTPVRHNDIPKNNFAARFLAIDAAPAPPYLTIAREGENLRLSWPVTPTSFFLESRVALDSGAWEPVVPQATRVGDFFQTTVPLPSDYRIFRLNSQPQPALVISADSGSVRLRWSSAMGGFTLQSKPALEAGAWTDVATPSRPTGDFYEVTAPAGSELQFFRLIKK